jgi:hypothetical protein
MRRLLVVSQSENDHPMKRLHQHLVRPKIYFTVGFGWNTDRLYHEKSKKETTTIKN